RRSLKMPDARNIREQVEARVAELEAILAPLRAEHEQLKDVAAAFGDTGGRAAPTLGTAPSRPRSRGAAAGAGAGGGGRRGEPAAAAAGGRPAPARPGDGRPVWRSDAAATDSAATASVSTASAWRWVRGSSEAASLGAMPRVGSRSEPRITSSGGGAP